MKILLPPGWPRPRGYSNGVAVKGSMVFVAGMIGWDAEGRFVGDDVAGHIVAEAARAARPERDRGQPVRAGRIGVAVHLRAAAKRIAGHARLNAMMMSG